MKAEACRNGVGFAPLDMVIQPLTQPTLLVSFNTPPKAHTYLYLLDFSLRGCKNPLAKPCARHGMKGYLKKRRRPKYITFAPLLRHILHLFFRGFLSSLLPHYMTSQ